MTNFELIFIALGLAMDAFAVSVSNGLAAKHLRVLDALKFGIFFGFFQMMMPLLGYLAGCLFSDYIRALDHWVAFFLLGYIGIKMIVDAKENDEPVCNTSLRMLLILSVATSIDALAAGITFAFMENVSIFLAVSLIGGITFVLSTAGALLGKRIGGFLGNKAQIAGGILLIFMGAKILVEHLFF